MLADTEKALEDKDVKSVGHLAHKLVGGAASLMCIGLQEACSRVENWGIQYENYGMDRDEAIKKQTAGLLEVKRQAVLFEEMLKRRQSAKKK